MYNKIGDDSLKKDNRNAIIIGLLITIAFMSVGYALLSTKVDQNELKTSVNGAYTDVEITTITSVETQGIAEDVRSFINGKTELVIYPKIVAKGDVITYNVNIKNNGTKKAVLNGIEMSKNEEEQIIYSVSNISVGDEILPGDSKMVTVEVYYDNDYEEEFVYNEEASEMKVTFDFSK